ncbi:MAG TPA: undecaprenyl-diphosphate phosphatase, partial [Actinomycetota bacterium]
VFGILLYVVDRSAPKRKEVDDVTALDALLIGTAQAMALSPGVSRSGATITAARWRGLERETAARFSFLLSLPVIAGAGVFKGLDVLETGLPPGMGPPFFWGFVASAISGFLVIWLLLAYVKKRDFAPFVVYRLAAALLVFGLVVTGARSATI